MSQGSIHIQRLGTEWFEQSHYRPRRSNGSDSRWFLLGDHFLPPQDLPLDPPPQSSISPAARRKAFEATYRKWNIPAVPGTQQTLERLDAHDAAVFVTGQQPGFLGGPLYTVFKAVSALAAANAYAARTGRPAAAVFWVASEDHDIDEIREARVSGAGGSEVAFRYPHPGDRREVWRYPIDEEATEILEAATAHFAGRRYATIARDLIDAYRGRHLASGFATLLTHLLGAEGLVVIDPIHLRGLTQPILRKVITLSRAVLDAIEEGRDDVRAAGIEPLVSGRFPLFIIRDGERHHLTPVDSGFRSGDGQVFSTAELLEVLESTPERLSTGALLRPIVAQYALPCVLTVGGPAEVGYFAQLPPLARLLGVEPPRIALRASATLIDGRVARATTESPPHTLARAEGPEELVREPADLNELEAFEKLADETRIRLRSFVDAAPEHPKRDRLGRKGDSIASDIVQLGRQLDRLKQEARGPRLERARKLWDFVFPHGSLQERRWSALDFIARHGLGWLGDLLKELEKDPLRVDHLWVTFVPDGPGAATDGANNAEDDGEDVAKEHA